MNKKILVQLLLFFFMLLAAGTYYYHYNKSSETNLNNVDDGNKISIKKSSSNLIENISYTSADNAGNKYVINSEKGEIKTENQNIVYMTNVIAIIEIVDSDPITIKSNYAKYNKINHETNFKENVLLTYQFRKIQSQNLDLSFENNIANIYNKITYTDNNSQLAADIMEIDLITKNSKIFMDNKYKKIKFSKQK